MMKSYLRIIRFSYWMFVANDYLLIEEYGKKLDELI